MMRFGLLFAGIGGFDLGLERAGMECAWQVEINEYCQKVLAKHWPDVERFSDVRECGKHNLRPVDLICGGFPCQPHSLAGQRRGSEDDRDLWPEMRRLIDEIRPRWMLAENVPGIRTTILDQVLSDLEDMGYTTGTLVVPACGVNAPHRRDRVWIVAHTRRWNTSQQCDTDTVYFGRNSTPRSTDSVGRSSGNGRQRIVEDPDGRGLPKQAICQEQQGGAETECSSKDVPNAVYDGSHCAQGNEAEQGRDQQEDGVPIRDAGNPTGQGLQDGGNVSMGGCKERYQKLQPERPDWWAVEPDVGRVAHGVPNRVDRLRALGNAVVPQVVEMIGRAILAADEMTYCVEK